MGEISCPSCGHTNQLGSNFCSSCGVRLGGGRDDRTDAIAVTDLVHSEPDDAQLDDSGFDRADFPPDVGVLFVSRGAKAGSRYALDEAVVSAGRHPDSGIFLDDVTVSRRHAEVTKVGDAYTVRDVGSLNGTYVNKELVAEVELRDGDELQIGKYKLVFFHGTAS